MLLLLLATLPVKHGLTQPASGTPPPAGLDAMVRTAREDAARQTGRPPTAFELVSAERVTWRDGSLGCPQPGVLYTMALVPGYRIRLRLDDEEFDYHGSNRGGMRRCPAGQAVDPLPDSRI